MQSIDNYAAQEEFIINDIILRVNATDIQVFDQKFTDSYSAIRNNSTYSISSNASIATYVSTLAFDLDNEDNLFNLVKLCTQLCKYPFLFIKSQRIDQFIPSVSKSINSYNIFAVKEWSIRHDSRAKNAIFVTIDMHYFNYVPYIKDFRFLDYALVDSSNTRTDNVTSKKASLLSVDNLYESKIFQDYFASDFNIKKEKTDIAIKSIIGSSHEIIFGSPEIIKAEGENAKKPIDIINSNIEYAGFEDQDTILVSYVNDNRQSSSSVEGELLNYWICYRDMPITLISDGDGNKIFDVQAMTITKKNNIVANQLQMYREPVIQYLGKSPAIMTVDISINNSEFEYSDFGHDANLKPYEILAHELRKAETFKVVGGNKLPFKSLRIRSLLNILADSNYFIIDSESSIESADDQGRQGVTLNFVESDITKLVGAGNLNLSSQSLYDKELYPMIFAASELLQLYSEETSLNVNKPKTNGGIPIASDDRIQVKIKNNKPSNKENTVIVNNTSSLVKLSLQERQKILSSGIDGEPNIDSLIALLFVGANNLIKSVAKGNMPAFDTYKDGLSKTAKALKLLATKLRDNKIKVDTSSQNFIEFFGTTSITLNLILGKNNGKNVESAQRYPTFYTKVLQSVYSNLNVNATKGSFNEIKGEALEDMSIFKSLVSGRFIREGSTDKEYLGESDNRKFSPFFFIDQYTYMDPVSLIATTSAITTIAGKTLEDKESLFNRDGVTISDSSNYIPLYKVKEIDAENKSATKTKKLGKIESTKNRLERLNKYANLAYEEYTKYIKENANNKNVNKSVILTKDLFFTIIAIESDGFPDAHRSGSSYYGLFQISKANWDYYYGKETFSSKWNDPVSNTRATLDFWHKYIFPELTNKSAKEIDLNPNSYFNLYMMHQQGAAGYKSIIKLYRNTSTRGAVVRDANLRERMASNFPGQNEAKTRWDYRPDSWLKAWKDKFYSKTGIDSQIFGYTEPVKTQGYAPLSVGNLTTGIGAPANANLIASIYKKQEGPESKAKPKVDDGDTFSFPSSMFEAREGKLPSGRLRIYGLDTKEKNHRLSGVGQKYSIDALLAAEDILSKMVYPIKIYSLGDTSGDRDLVIVVDKNGSDFTYEMLKTGLAKYSPLQEEELKGRSGIYRDIYNQTESLLKVDSQETSQDATKKTIGGSEAQTTFDIQSYENKVAIALGDNSGDYTLSQRSDALISGTDDPDRLTRPDDGLLTRPGKDAYYQIDTDSKPYGLEFDEDINMQYRCIRTGNHIASGLDLAVPSVKAYIVEGLRSDEFARYNLVAPRETNLYEISGLTDVRIETPTPDNPVSVAAFTVLNPGSIYTDIAAIARRGGGYYPDYTEDNLDPNFASKSGKLILKSGTRIHIRIGYCVDSDTEILTDNGWTRYDKLSINDNVFTLNHETGKSEWNKVDAINIFENTNEDMISIDGQFHSSLTTLDHKWPVYKDYSNNTNKRQREWTTSKELQTNHKIILGAEFDNFPKEKIHKDSFVELVAWFWTEGQICNIGQNRNPLIKISQSNSVNMNNVVSIRKACHDYFEKPSEILKGGKVADHNKKWNEKNRNNRSETLFTINASGSKEFLRIAPGKIVSLDFIKELTRDQLELFIKISNLADGHNCKTHKSGFIISQKNKDMLNALEFACILLGYRTKLYTSNKVNIDRNGNTYKMTILSVGYRQTMGFTDIKPTKVIYNGITWCPTTKNHTWLAKRKGCVFFTGNSNNPNELETIFNGEIVEIEGEEILQVIAEGYGRELIAIDKAVEEPEDLGSKSATTNLVIHRLLEADEIYHLGLKKYATNVTNPVGRNILDGATVDASDPNLTSNFTKVWEAIYGWLAGDDPNGIWFGDWWAKSSELYTNVYSPVIQGMDPEMSGDIKIRYLISTVKDIDLIFPLYKSTTWEALREVQYRHPGTYMNVMNYKERGSLFFGIKEQMYIHTDPPISMFTGSTESFETYNKEVNAIKHKLLKPATDMHLIVSERDIISNQIKINGGFKTQINVRYFDSMPSAEGIEDMSDYNFYTMQLDDNLRPNAIRSKTLYMNACHQQFMAYRYGTTELVAEAEKMYDGKIIIVGNPYMKAGDYAYINDSCRGLNGIIKIRSCSHIINSKDGYITVITPGLFIEPRVYRYSNLYTKLGLAWTVAANKIKNDAKVNFFDTRKIKYVTSFMEILTNPLLAEQLNSSPLSYGNKSALALDLTLKASPGVIGGVALYRAFPWLTRQVISVAAIISSSTLGGAISTAATSARVSTGLLLGARSLGGGALGFLSRVSLATLGGLSAGVQRGVSIAAVVAASPALVAAGTTIIGATILAMYLYQTIEEINQTRQPIVMYPLLNNGIPYQAGLFGYEINTLSDSFGLEFNKTMSAINTIYKAARSEYLRSSESDNAKLEKTLKYLNTINKTASPDLFYRSKEIKW